jgi:hypothetical protein
VTLRAWEFAVVVVLATAGWLAAYRLPWRTPRARQRFRLAVASRTGLPARYVFPVFGTVFYLFLGALAALAMVGAAPAGWTDPVPWKVSAHGVALTVLAALGSGALVGAAMAVLYAVRPRVDVPGAVTGVRWVREILALPRFGRWLVPAGSAALEELVFRGVALTGLLAAGASGWAALAVAGLVFTAGQVALTETRLQALVLTISSVVVSVLGGLLVLVEGSVLPAILVHASFAGYYTSLRTPP